METLINRPSRSLQYFAIAKQWSLDLDFHRTELVFLNRLLDDYFIRLSAPHYIEKLKGNKKDLCIVEEQGRKTEELLSLQIVFLEMMSDDVIPEDVQSLEAKQINLEYLMNDINRAFRKTKKVLFRMIEELVQNDDLYD
ncbi:MAG TPA: hypothetical protein VK541_07275 [Pedobacter sp.]|uniref:hypothetical protein n=1 Tax=Pedobacter sp. TaxID=1411316 RepID=UPI002CD0DA2E|nr:hypothetical protein [Pedobacter sp.]HMI02265.1 hypothetical protein [Pedobacter sp.]